MTTTLTVRQTVVRELSIPEGATHFYGNLMESPLFYKCTQVGVAGDHWWVWSPGAWTVVYGRPLKAPLHSATSRHNDA